MSWRVSATAASVVDSSSVDDGGAIVGASPRHGDCTDEARLAAMIANKTAPALAVGVEVIETPAGAVVAIEVPKPTWLVATTDGVYVRRAIDVNGRPHCLPMRPHEAMARITSLGAQDLSRRWRSPAPASTTSTTLILENSSDSETSPAPGETPFLGELSDLDLLAALGFRTPTADVTLGAILLFGASTALARYAPTHETAFQVLDALEVKVNRIERSPLIKSMVDLVEAIKPHNPQEEIEDGLFRVGLPVYSDIAIRELLANALVHGTTH